MPRLFIFITKYPLLWSILASFMLFCFAGLLPFTAALLLPANILPRILPLTAGLFAVIAMLFAVVAGARTTIAASVLVSAVFPILLPFGMLLATQDELEVALHISKCMLLIIGFSGAVTWLIYRAIQRQ